MFLQFRTSELQMKSILIIFFLGNKFMAWLVSKQQAGDGTCDLFTKVGLKPTVEFLLTLFHLSKNIMAPNC